MAGTSPNGGNSPACSSTQPIVKKAVLSSADCFAGLEALTRGGSKRRAKSCSTGGDRYATSCFVQEIRGLLKAQARVGSTPHLTRKRQEYLYRLGIQKDEKAAAKQRRLRARAETLGVSPEALEGESPASADEVDLRMEARGDEEAAEELGLNEAPPVPDSANPEFEAVEQQMPTQDDFRVQYLRRLSYANVWVPPARRAKKHQAVIIFDWDDTLLCTTAINESASMPLYDARGINGPSYRGPPAVESQFEELGQRVAKLLELAASMGKTFIITNAMSNWVEMSAARYIPEVLPVLSKVDVISARSRFEGSYAEVPQWKVQAFLEVSRELDSEIITNLVCLGDSCFEMDAVHIMSKEFSQALVKTIQFRERPSLEELNKQISLVCSKFEKIVESARNLRIGLERRTGPGAAAGASVGTSAASTAIPATSTAAAIATMRRDGGLTTPNSALL